MWALLLASLWLCQLAACSDTNKTSFVEVDVVFPREKETYAPMPLMPVVFSVHDPDGVAKYLEFQIEYVLTNDDDSSRDTRYHQLKVDLAGNGPTHFLYDTIRHIADTEGSWQFGWQMLHVNCTADEELIPYVPATDADKFNMEGISNYGRFSFNTKNGAKQPDLQNKDNCEGAVMQQYGVQKIIPVNPQATHWTEASCASLHFPEPTARPCSITVDAAAASSISSQITASECSSYRKAVVTCPADESAAVDLRVGLRSYVALVASCILASAFVL